MRFFKKHKYLLLTLLYVVGLVISVFSLLDALGRSDNFRIFRRGVMIFLFLFLVIENARKHKRAKAAEANNHLA